MRRGTGAKNYLLVHGLLTSTGLVSVYNPLRGSFFLPNVSLARACPVSTGFVFGIILFKYLIFNKIKGVIREKIRRTRVIRVPNQATAQRGPPQFCGSPPTPKLNRIFLNSDPNLIHVFEPLGEGIAKKFLAPA